MLNNLKQKITNQKHIKWWLDRFKRHGKFFIISFLALSCLFSACTLMKTYSELQKSARLSTEEFIKEWTTADKTTLAKRFDTEETYFQINTGFDNNALTNILSKTTYQGTEITIKDVKIKYGIGEEKTTAEVRVLIHTYDNMAILEKLFENILADKSAVTHNYNEKALINKHIVALEKNIKDYEKSFQAVENFYLTWNDESNSWDWDLDSNYVGINRVSGNMFEYMKKIGVSE